MINRKLILENNFQMNLIETPVKYEIEEEEVLIKITASGICGSDLHYFKEGGLGTFRSKMPLHLGHEAAGIVAETRSKDFLSGDQVAVEPGHSCGSCVYCEHKRPNICEDVKFLGANLEGAQGDYLKVHSSQLIKVSSKLPAATAALLEPYSVGLHNALLGKNSTFHRQVERIAILGGGTIGNMIAFAASLEFPEAQIHVFEPAKSRRNIAQVSCPKSVTHYALSELDPKSKYEIVYDAVGNPNSFSNMQKLVANGGVCILVGIPEVDNLQINPHILRIKEANLIFSRRSACDLGRVNESFMEIKKLLGNFVTHTFYPNQGQIAYETAANWAGGSMKVQINWA